MCSLAWFMIIALLFGSMILMCLPIIGVIVLIMFCIRMIKSVSKKGGDKNEEP